MQDVQKIPRLYFPKLFLNSKISCISTLFKKNSILSHIAKNNAIFFFKLRGYTTYFKIQNRFRKYHPIFSKHPQRGFFCMTSERHDF